MAISKPTADSMVHGAAPGAYFLWLSKNKSQATLSKSSLALRQHLVVGMDTVHMMLYIL